jgi:protein TonB
MPRTGIPAFVAEIRAVSAPSVAMRKRRSALLPASAVLHALLVGAMIVIPLLSPEELPPPPEGGLKAFFVQPAAAPPPPPPPPGPAPVGKPMPKAVASAPPTFTAPIEVPQEVKPEQRLDVGVADGVPGGVVGGVVGGLPDVAPTPQAPVLVGGAIRAPKQLKWVEPVYPDLAIRSSVEGVIIIECTIDPAGRVSHARVLRGVPILDDAALDAVKQWVFTPTLLGGVPIPVIMTVTVGFKLR